MCVEILQFIFYFRVGLSAGTGFGMSPMSSSLIPAPPSNPVPNQNEVNNNGIANQNEVNNNGLANQNANNNEDGVHIADNHVQTNNAHYLFERDCLLYVHHLHYYWHSDWLNHYC
jgi:hypothetical protein